MQRFLKVILSATLVAAVLGDRADAEVLTLEREFKNDGNRVEVQLLSLPERKAELLIVEPMGSPAVAYDISTWQIDKGFEKVGQAGILSPDRKSFLIQGRRSLSVFETGSWQKRSTLALEDTFYLRPQFLADSKHVLVREKIYDLESGQMVRDFSQRRDRCGEIRLWTLPIANQIAMFCPRDQVIHVFSGSSPWRLQASTPSGGRAATLGDELILSPNQKYAVLAGSGPASIYVTGDQWAKMDLDIKDIEKEMGSWWAKFSADSKLLMVGALGLATVYIVDTQTQRVLKKLPLRAEDGAFAPDNKSVLLMASDGLEILEIESGRSLMAIENVLSDYSGLLLAQRLERAVVWTNHGEVQVFNLKWPKQ